MTYVKALELLSQVERDSISVYDARDYTVELRRSIKVFEKRRKQERARLAQAQLDRSERESSLESAQRFTSGVDKAAVFAHECEEELEQYEARMGSLEGLKE